MKADVTASSVGTWWESEPLTSCATIEPTRPVAASAAKAEARTLEGKHSAESTSSAFQPR